MVDDVEEPRRLDKLEKTFFFTAVSADEDNGKTFRNVKMGSERLRRFVRKLEHHQITFPQTVFSSFQKTFLLQIGFVYWRRCENEQDAVAVFVWLEPRRCFTHALFKQPYQGELYRTGHNLFDLTVIFEREPAIRRGS